MLFHTWTFLFFLAVVLPVYFALQKTRLWVPWLLLASYVFYGWWNPYYLILVVYSTALDYYLVALMDHCPLPSRSKAAGGDSPLPTDAPPQKIRPISSDPVLKWSFMACTSVALGCIAIAFFGEKSLRPLMWGLALIFGLSAAGAWFSNRKVWLVISLVNNLSLLVFFKYAGFFIDNLNLLGGRFGWAWKFPAAQTFMPFGWEYFLPVGISFYTFQSMSYSIDFYFGHIHRERSFIRFATFVSFFPQLVAGPIERASNLLPQFYRFPKVTREDVADGLSLFLTGLFKKLALANYLSLYVERMYEQPGTRSGGELAMATFAFAWQIFFDFSGYTDMARGVARVMGFQLMLNFNNPYLATGLGDFWSRWHISLSTWFRDYVYIPLGGNRKSAARTYGNLFVVFLISGVWHGAAWTYVMWGFIHAVGVIATRELERSEFYRRRFPKFLKQLGTFVVVCLAWIFFRAESLADAATVYGKIFSTQWRPMEFPALLALLVGTIWGYQYLYESKARPMLALAPVRIGLAVSMVIYLLLFSTSGGAFIYFQF
jgi:D-alanyl-lipoteichoic acid acyltransferase DltB (MBOAT superfamily)